MALFETGPDKSDGHTHLAELDQDGDGVTDEAGDYPHTHEVNSGMVIPMDYRGYVSEHPGKLVALEQPGADQNQNADPEASGAPAADAAVPAQESIKTAIRAIMEGVIDPENAAWSLMEGVTTPTPRYGHWDSPADDDRASYREHRIRKRRDMRRRNMKG